MSKNMNRQKVQLVLWGIARCTSLTQGRWELLGMTMQVLHHTSNAWKWQSHRVTWRSNTSKGWGLFSKDKYGYTGYTDFDKTSVKKKNHGVSFYFILYIYINYVQMQYVCMNSYYILWNLLLIMETHQHSSYFFLFLT